MVIILNLWYDFIVVYVWKWIANQDWQISLTDDDLFMRNYSAFNSYVSSLRVPFKHNFMDKVALRAPD